jgi:hypothetical protein
MTPVSLEPINAPTGSTIREKIDHINKLLSSDKETSAKFEITNLAYKTFDLSLLDNSPSDNISYKRRDISFMNFMSTIQKCYYSIEVLNIYLTTYGESIFMYLYPEMNCMINLYIENCPNLRNL